MGWFSGLLRRDPPDAEAHAPADHEAMDRAAKGPGRSTSPVRLTSQNFDRFLREHPHAVVDVWAPWCGPCRAFAPVFAEAASRWGDRIGFGKVHADHEPSIVGRFGIRSIPSLLFFEDGELVRSEVGVVPPNRLVRYLRKSFGASAVDEAK